MSKMKKKQSLGTCVICDHQHDFELPDHLKRKLYQGEVIFFVGAGVSTENPTVFPYTFYEDIKGEIGLPPDPKTPFSEVMEKFCLLPDGRIKLLQKIRERFDYIASFPELYRFATRFHSELATLHFVQSIITTNWDDYFEKECGAIPFVTADDFALWQTKGRKVFKIHGSINNYGSLVATDTDYNTCYESLRDGILGATLKQLLGTKTVVYVGYSMQDSDFQQIYKFLKDEMQEVLPHSYVITPFEDEAEQFRSSDMTPIVTDGQHFLATLKKHAIADEQMVNDDNFVFLSKLYELFQMAHKALHKEVNPYEYPYMVYCACYQDGYMQALERAKARVKTGEYSIPNAIPQWIQHYIEIRADKEKSGRHHDVAYVDGYITALRFMLGGKDSQQESFLFYVYGATEHPEDIEAFKAQLVVKGVCNKKVLTYAKRLIKESKGKNSEVEIHYQPFLL